MDLFRPQMWKIVALLPRMRRADGETSFRAVPWDKPPGNGRRDVRADELKAALPRALAAGTVIPIFCTSSKKDKDIGIAELLDGLAAFALSPVQGKRRTAVKGS